MPYGRKLRLSFVPILITLAVLAGAEGSDSPASPVSADGDTSLGLVEVITPDGDASSPASESQGCWITVRWQSHLATVVPDESSVRVRGGWWKRLVRPGGFALADPPVSIHAYSDHRYNSNYWLKTELRQNCNKRRRYRFRLLGRESPALGSHRYEGVERRLYFPSRKGWTRTTNLDLGYLEQCLMDGSKCSKPYYPGGNRNPPPPK